MPPCLRAFRSHAFTLIEMLTTVAVLIILLGLMVSLARFVRDRSSEQLTRQLLRWLDDMAIEYRARTKSMLRVTPLIPTGAAPLEARVRKAAEANNEELVSAMRQELARAQRPGQEGGAGSVGELSIALYNGRMLLDSWGNPIVFMPDQNQYIGMAPGDRPSFFFSAGPDGRYLSRADNLYSYEQGPTGPP
ncbi:MAG: pilus assembly FimT family protein [Tepidisphaeraceae bacterium]